MTKRRENRFKPNQTVTARPLGLGSGSVMQASIIDISDNGMRLRSKLPLRLGTPIEIEWNTSIARGSVCRCEPENDSYELGIQISIIEALA